MVFIIDDANDYDNRLSMILIKDDAEIIENIFEIIMSVSFILARISAYIIM